MSIIEASDLTKTYKRFKKQEGVSGSVRSLFRRQYEEKTALDHVTLEIGSGEFVGIIGPNGAGKTTLMKMLTGIVSPSSGRLQVMGYCPDELKNEFKSQYALVMGQKSQLFFELTTQDTLRLFKEIYGISETEYRKNRDYFVELFGVKDLLDVQVRTLSLGERMKMELITALLHNPRVLFLDEPSIGLDAVASRQIREFLSEINKEKGTTILLTSHYMEDIRTLCDRSVVINHGCKIYDGKTEELFEKYQKYKLITIVFHEPVSHVSTGRGVQILEETPYKKKMMVPKEQANAVLDSLMKYGLQDISVQEEEIGVIVERIYGEGGAADE